MPLNSHATPLPSDSREAVSIIDVQGPGPLHEVALSASKSPLLRDPSGAKRIVIDVPSSEKWACIIINRHTVRSWGTKRYWQIVEYSTLDGGSSLARQSYKQMP